MTEGRRFQSRSLALDAAALALGSVFTQAAMLGSTIVLARVLVPSQLGGYQQLLLIYGILAPLLLGGIPAALTFQMARAETEDERRRWVFVAFVALGVLGALFAVLLALLRAPIAEAMNNADLDDAILLYAPYTFFAFVSAVMPNSLIPIGRAGLTAGLTALFAGVYVVCIVTGALVSDDVEGLALAASVSGAITATISVVVVVFTVGLRADWANLVLKSKRFLAYGFPLALTGITGVLGYQFDRLVVSGRFSPAEYAIYAIGAVELPVTLIVQQSINSVLLPALARRHRDGDIHGMSVLWREAIRKTSLVLFPVFALCFVTAGELVHVLFGARYDESADILRIYLLLMPLRVATYGVIPMAIGRTGINLSASFIVLIANAVLALALVGPLGLEGPALATVLATVLTAAYYLVRLRAILSLPIRSLFPWRVLAVNLGIAVACGLVIVPLRLLDLPDVALLAAAGVLYAVAYLCSMRSARRITDEDWARLRATAARAIPRRPIADRSA